MKGLEWISDVEEPKVLGEEDVFDMHLFCKIKYIYHILPSGKRTHFTHNKKKFFMGGDTCTTSGIFNMKTIKTMDTSSSETISL